MDEQSMFHSHNEILLLNNKEWTIDTCYNTDESQNGYAAWKKPDQKEYTLGGSIYIKFCKMQTNP